MIYTVEQVLELINNFLVPNFFLRNVLNQNKHLRSEY